jgi:O-methyltransferase
MVREHSTADYARATKLLHLSAEEREGFRRITEETISSGRTLLDVRRLYILWQAVGNARRIPGAFLEVGTYRGGSAFFIGRALEEMNASDRPFHVIDTFEGHPVFSTRDEIFHKPGLFGDAQYRDVCAFLGLLPNIIVHKGAFEAVEPNLAGIKFVFSHIDVDTYVSTLNCLNFLARSLQPGGVVVLDDFCARKCPGVEKAAKEFMSEHRNYHLFRMETEQASLIRLDGS